jgi:heptosyltransferase-3
MIVSREFGDGLLALRSIESISEANPEIKWTVWCRPKTAALFKQHQHIDCVIENEFPMGAKWNFGFRQAVQLLKNIVRMRFRRRFLFSMDLLGDFREASLGIATNGRQHYSPSWSQQHELSGLIRTAPRWMLSNAVPMTTTGQSVYQQYQQLATQVCNQQGLRPPVNIDSQPQPNSSKRVGIHPTGTCPSKSWPLEHWLSLIDQLHEKGYRVAIFGAPAERPQLVTQFSQHVNSDDIITGSLAEFEEATEGLDLLVGLDSFSVHMAYRKGTPSVVLNSANYPLLWTPPNSAICRTEGLCNMQPCLHKAPCADSDDAYICMTQLKPEKVLTETLKQLSG